ELAREANACDGCGMQAALEVAMKRFSLFCTWSVLALTACGPEGFRGDGGDQSMDFQSIDVTPETATIYVMVTDGMAMPDAVDYHAVAHLRSGGTRDVTAIVHWAVDDPIASFESGAHLVAGTARGGQTRVRAQLPALEGAANLTVIIRGSTITPGTPRDAPM